MRMIIPVLIILVGVGIILYPTAKEKYMDYQGDKAIEELEELIENGDENIDVSLGDGEEDGDPEDLALGDSDIEKTDSDTAELLGILYIDKIDLKLAIAEGTSYQALNGTIAGHEPDTAKPNELGNCALASHRSLTYGRNFNRLDEIKKDNEIIIKTTSGSVVYKVNKVYKVKKTNIEPLEQPNDKNKKMITLITCDPKGVENPPNRLIVQAVAKE